VTGTVSLAFLILENVDSEVPYWFAVLWYLSDSLWLPQCMCCGIEGDFLSFAVQLGAAVNGCHNTEVSSHVFVQT
jgi:hypothetical protein